MTGTYTQLPSFTQLDSWLFFPQNLPSVVVGHVLNPQENDMILDMCASPGNAFCSYMFYCNLTFIVIYLEYLVH